MAKKLRAPAGTDEVNFGTERYRVGNDGTVEVPDEAVPTLKGVGGLTDADDPVRVAADGHALMKSTVGPMSFSYEGQSYSTDDDDIVDVPLLAVDHLMSHGLVLQSVQSAQPAPDIDVDPQSEPTDGEHDPEPESEADDGQEPPTVPEPPAES